MGLVAVSVAMLFGGEGGGGVRGVGAQNCTADQVHIALGNAYYYSMPGTTPIEGEDNYDMSITFHTEVPFHPPMLISAGGVCWYVRSYFRR